METWNIGEEFKEEEKAEDKLLSSHAPNEWRGSVETHRNSSTGMGGLNIITIVLIRHFLYPDGI